MSDYYEVLGIKRGAKQEAIRAAYRKLAQQYHPDRIGGDEKKFAELQEAYRILINPTLRSGYDEKGIITPAVDEHLKDLTLIGQMLIAAIEQSNQIDIVSPVDQVRSKLANMLVQLEQQFEINAKRIVKRNKVLRKLSYKGVNQDKDFLVQMIKADIQTIERFEASAQQEKIDVTRRIALLDNYEYAPDPYMAQNPYQ